MSFKLFCDSTCDLTDALAKEYRIEVIPMQFSLNDKNYNHYLDCREMSLSDFYTALKNNADVKTSQVQFAMFEDAFEPVLENGEDIIYICFSSGLSGTYNTCNIVVDDLRIKYPERKITVIDSVCASIGEGYLALLAAKKMNEGADYFEVLDYIEAVKFKIMHWFVVDDLNQLKKGGRIGALSATFGKALQIKPLLSVNDEGKLVAVSKIRGSSKVVSTIVEKVQRDAEDMKNQIVLVAHSECIEKAEALKEMFTPLCKEVIMSEIGPIIGSHVGQGMCAAVCIGTRNLT